MRSGFLPETQHKKLYLLFAVQKTSKAIIHTQSCSSCCRHGRIMCFTFTYRLLPWRVKPRSLSVKVGLWPFRYLPDVNAASGQNPRRQARIIFLAEFLRSKQAICHFNATSRVFLGMLFSCLRHMVYDGSCKIQTFSQQRAFFSGDSQAVHHAGFCLSFHSRS